MCVLVCSVYGCVHVYIHLTKSLFIFCSSFLPSPAQLCSIKAFFWLLLISGLFYQLGTRFDIHLPSAPGLENFVGREKRSREGAQRSEVKTER